MAPLHVAAETGYFEIVEYLVGKKADINIQDKKGVIICNCPNNIELLWVWVLIYNWILVRSEEDLNQPAGILGAYVLIQCLSVTPI